MFTQPVWLITARSTLTVSFTIGWSETLRAGVTFSVGVGVTFTVGVGVTFTSAPGTLT